MWKLAASYPRALIVVLAAWYKLAFLISVSSPMLCLFGLSRGGMLVLFGLKLNLFLIREVFGLVRRMVPYKDSHFFKTLILEGLL